MAWYDGLFGSDSGINDQDKGKLANQGLLQAGLGILAANGQRGVTPFQAIAGGLLGGLGSVQQGTADIQNQRYKNAIEQSTIANMQASQAQAQQAAAQKKALHDALAANTDAGGNVDIAGAVRQYGKSYPEDAANALTMLHGGKPELKDTPQGALQIYPDGYNAYLQAGGLPSAVGMDGMPSSIPAPLGSPGGSGAYTPPPPLLAAQAQVESGNNPAAVSLAGALGTMQTLPSTLRDPGFGVLPARDNSPSEMTRVGNDYSTALQQKYGPVGGLAAYNWGPGNWDKALAANGGNPQAALASAPAETQAYVPKVLAGAGGFPQGGNPSQLPPGHVSLSGPSKTVNADDQKFQRLVGMGYSRDQAAQAAYGVKPAPAVEDNPQSWDDGLSDDQKKIVQGLANYTIPTSSRFFQTPANQRLVARAQLLNPDFNAAQYQQNQKLISDFASSSPNSAGGGIQAINTAAAHVAEMASMSKDLPSSNFPLWNKAELAGSSAVGGSLGNTLKGWNTARQLFAGEMAKAVKGGVASQAEVQGLEDQMDAAATPDQRASALQATANFLIDRQNALKDRRDQVLGAQSPGTSLFTKRAQDALTSVYALNGAHSPDLGAPSQTLGYKPLMSSPKPNAGWSIQMVSN